MWSCSNSSRSLVWWATSERFVGSITWKKKLTVACCFLVDWIGIKAALKQSKEIGSTKTDPLAHDLQQKVKQYECKLSNVVQRVQVCHRFTNPTHSSNSVSIDVFDRSLVVDNWSLEPIGYSHVSQCLKHLQYI
jgi:hypothetical protein